MTKKTLTELEEAIARKAYGKHAKPTLIEDKSIEGFIKANSAKKETGWKVFAKGLLV